MSPDLSLMSVADVRRRFLGCRPTTRLLALLREDPRRGVRQVYEILKKKAADEKGERSRIAGLQWRERTLWKAGVRHVAGVDEAGIGPLAGPVVAAAVVFPPGVWIAGVDDSKRLPPEGRRALLEQIWTEAEGVGTGVAEVDEIDELNIYQAGLLAMKRAVANLSHMPDYVLTDARNIPDLEAEQEAVKQGDARCFCIAAASIVAKTSRDALMSQLDRRYPEYGFARHKGYATREHVQALRKHGPAPVHRRSFVYLEEVCGNCSPLFYSYVSELGRLDSPERLASLEGQWKMAAPEFTDYERRKFNQRVAHRRRQLEAEAGRVRNG